MERSMQPGARKRSARRGRGGAGSSVCDLNRKRALQASGLSESAQRGDAEGTEHPAKGENGAGDPAGRMPRSPHRARPAGRDAASNSNGDFPAAHC